MSTAMTLRRKEDVETRLGKLADATRRSKSLLAAEAIREYVENSEWRIREINAAAKEANADDFADDAEVAALAKKWKLDAGYLVAHAIRNVAAMGPFSSDRTIREHVEKVWTAPKRR